MSKSVGSVNFVKNYHRDRLDEVYDGKVPFKIRKRLEFFRKMDSEYKFNIDLKRQQTERKLNRRTLFSKKIVNKDWYGFWLRATGNDEVLYMTYLIEARENYKNNLDVNSIKSFKESNPKEKYVPFSIEVVNEDIKIKENDIEEDEY